MKKHLRWALCVLLVFSSMANASGLIFDNDDSSSTDTAPCTCDPNNTSPANNGLHLQLGNSGGLGDIGALLVLLLAGLNQHQDYGPRYRLARHRGLMPFPGGASGALSGGNGLSLLPLPNQGTMFPLNAGMGNGATIFNAGAAPALVMPSFGSGFAGGAGVQPLPLAQQAPVAPPVVGIR